MSAGETILFILRLADLVSTYKSNYRETKTASDAAGNLTTRASNKHRLGRTNTASPKELEPQNLNACTWSVLIRMKRNAYLAAFVLTFGAMVVEAEAQGLTHAPEGTAALTIGLIDLAVYAIAGVILSKVVWFLISIFCDSFKIMCPTALIGAQDHESNALGGDVPEEAPGGRRAKRGSLPTINTKNTDQGVAKPCPGWRTLCMYFLYGSGGTIVILFVILAIIRGPPPHSPPPPLPPGSPPQPPSPPLPPNPPPSPPNVPPMATFEQWKESLKEQSVVVFCIVGFLYVVAKSVIDYLQSKITDWLKENVFDPIFDKVAKKICNPVKQLGEHIQDWYGKQRKGYTPLQEEGGSTETTHGEQQTLDEDHYTSPYAA